MNPRTSTLALAGIILILVLVIGFLLIRGSGPVSPTTTSTSATTTASTTATNALADIKSFEDCRKAGYPVTGTAPRQCKLPDGRVYAEEKPVQPVYRNATSDQIRITQPEPGAVTGKSFTISGQARGGWYSEAVFPIRILDKNGATLATAQARAQGEWMTTNFVPFTAQVTVLQSYIGAATIVLMKDNPSGLPQNDASLSVPITIEY